MSGDPYPKAVQLARQEKRYHRTVASAKQWEKLHAEKQGPCWVTLMPPPNELAHLISRAQGGPDAAWNLIPLTRAAHSLFDMRDPDTCRAVCESLTDEEYAGLIEFAGEGVFERRFGIAYERVT